MAIINSEHLLDQAEKLIAPPAAGPPRQVDIRRAISASYYAVFHTVTTAVADRYVGSSLRTSAEYGLVYRSIDHNRIRDLCADLAKVNPPKKFHKYLPENGMDHHFAEFADAVVFLRERRHMADYDPAPRLKTADAQIAIKTARSAIQRFARTSKASSEALLSLLVFLPRT